MVMSPLMAPEIAIDSTVPSVRASSSTDWSLATAGFVTTVAFSIAARVRLPPPISL